MIAALSTYANAVAAKAELAAAQGITLAEKVDNPLKGVTPKIDVFGVKFNNAISVILGGIWALGLVIAVVYILINTTKWAAARQQGRADDMTDGMDGLKRSALAFGVLAGAGVVVGAILNLVGML